MLCSVKIDVRFTLIACKAASSNRNFFCLRWLVFGYVGAHMQSLHSETAIPQPGRIAQLFLALPHMGQSLHRCLKNVSGMPSAFIGAALSANSSLLEELVQEPNMPKVPLLPSTLPRQACPCPTFIRKPSHIRRIRILQRPSASCARAVFAVQLSSVTRSICEEPRKWLTILVSKLSHPQLQPRGIEAFRLVCRFFSASSTSINTIL
jgi:hypothetical protein